MRRSGLESRVRAVPLRGEGAAAHPEPFRDRLSRQPVACRSGSLNCWKAYLRDLGGDVSPYAAPARASDLSRLPPAYLMVAERDLLLDENADYARRLIEAGVGTEVHLYPGTFHGFDSLDATAAGPDTIRRGRLTPATVH